MSDLGPLRPEEKHYLFVDGAYLRNVVQKLTRKVLGEPTAKLDYRRLRGDHHKAFHYDCLPPPKKGELEESYRERKSLAAGRHARLARHERYHFIEGVTVGTGQAARQKKVDVKLATDALTHGFRRNMQRATVLTGDLDFFPLIEGLVWLGVDVTVWCERSSRSADLVEAADTVKYIDGFSVLRLLAPDVRKQFGGAPEDSVEPRPESGSIVLLQRGVAEADGMILELYRYRDGAFFWLPMEEQPGYCRRVAHSDANLLKRAAEATYGGINWSHPREPR